MVKKPNISTIIPGDIKSTQVFLQRADFYRQLPILAQYFYDYGHTEQIPRAYRRYTEEIWAQSWRNLGGTLEVQQSKVEPTNTLGYGKDRERHYGN